MYYKLTMIGIFSALSLFCWFSLASCMQFSFIST